MTPERIAELRAKRDRASATRAPFTKMTLDMQDFDALLDAAEERNKMCETIEPLLIEVEDAAVELCESDRKVYRDIAEALMKYVHPVREALTPSPREA
jgi:hypothetical protein